ncbi:MAG: hypothetical protein IH860_05040, partial [Chloroflexi bacterium]|nr:hypothetical protein [Chloroflexota bacterium]
PFNLFVGNTLELLDAYAEFDFLESEHFRLLIHSDESAVLGPALLDEAEACGRDPSAIGWSLFLWIYMGDHPEELRQKATREIRRRFGGEWGRGGELQFGQATALGRPQDCIEIIEEYASLGINHFVLDAPCPPSEIIQQYERIAAEVLPHFRGRGS